MRTMDSLGSTFQRVQGRNHETFRREDGDLETNSVIVVRGDEQDWAGF